MIFSLQKRQIVFFGLRVILPTLLVTAQMSPSCLFGETVKSYDKHLCIRWVKLSFLTHEVIRNEFILLDEYLNSEYRPDDLQLAFLTVKVPT